MRCSMAAEGYRAHWLASLGSRAMRLGVNLGYWGAGNDADNLALAQEADRLGYSVGLGRRGLRLRRGDRARLGRRADRAHRRRLGRSSRSRPGRRR